MRDRETCFELGIWQENSLSILVYQASRWLPSRAKSERARRNQISLKSISGNRKSLQGLQAFSNPAGS